MPSRMIKRIDAPVPCSQRSKVVQAPLHGQQFAKLLAALSAKSVWPPWDLYPVGIRTTGTAVEVCPRRGATTRLGFQLAVRLAASPGLLLAVVVIAGRSPGRGDRFEEVEVVDASWPTCVGQRASWVLQRVDELL